MYLLARVLKKQLPNILTLVDSSFLCLSSIGYEPQIKFYPPHKNSPTHTSIMSTATGKLLEFFICISKLLPDGSNWVIFKDRFAFTAAAAVLNKHFDATSTELVSPVFP
jgi:hypothetical protein